MSPAIMFCGARTTLNASRGFPRCQILLSAWSFCLIGVLIGVGARNFLCSALGLLFLSERKHRALSRALPAVTRAALGSCNECGARRALAYSAN